MARRMLDTARRRYGARAAWSALALAAGLLVAGCTPVQPTPTPTPTATNNLGVTCSELVPRSVLDAVHPQLTLDKHYTPQTGSYPHRIVELGGIACSWLSPDKESVDVAAVKMDKSTLASEEAKVKAGATSTLAFGSSPEIRGYEVNSGGTYTGDMEVFTDTGYWISTQSPLFFAPSDAESVIGAVLQVLPSG